MRKYFFNKSNTIFIRHSKVNYEMFVLTNKCNYTSRNLNTLDF